MNWKGAPVQGDNSCSEVRKCLAILRAGSSKCGWNKIDWGTLLRMKSVDKYLVLQGFVHYTKEFALLT